MRYLMLILTVCILAAVICCEGVTDHIGVIENGSAWQCITEPGISVGVVDRISGKVYCEVRTDKGVGTMTVPVIDLQNMVKDGHWVRVADTEPLCGPPPPGWNDFVVDRVKGIRINGSTLGRMSPHSPMPEHQAIDVIE